MRRNGWQLAAMMVAALWTLTAAAGGGRGGGNKIVSGLSDRSFKVRLQAATLAGKSAVRAAIPRLRQLLSDDEEHISVRAASAMSLARLGDQRSRTALAYLIGHREALLAKSAEKALIALDRARRDGPPEFLVSVEAPDPAGGRADSHSALAARALRQKVEQTGGVVPGAGEDQVLHETELEGHLARRGLAGMVLRVDRASVEERTEPDRTVFVGQVSLTGLTLVDRRREFTAGGEANAWVETEEPSAADRRELTEQVLDGATDAAFLQALQQILGEGGRIVVEEE